VSKTRDPSTRVVGVVLAGGSSSRYGADKALIELGGESLVARARKTLAAVCADVVVADAGRGLLPAAESVGDGPGRGPAAGILGAAAARPGRALLVLACDLPCAVPALLERLARAGGDWVVPRLDGKLEPLCALYRPRAIEALAAQVRRGEHALHRLAEAAIDVRYLDAGAIADLGDPHRLFANVNTPDDLDALTRSYPGPLP
jgi:molybdopterin-guanine dinucleotide biosynthesis protein A